MKLWQIGLIIFILSGIINAIWINLSVGGIIRELTRLSAIVGIFIFFMGLVRRKK